jgi:hypothetical protein
MHHLRALSLLCALAFLSVPTSSRAEVVIQTPVGTFVVGRPGARPAPLVSVQVGGIGVQVNPGGCSPAGPGPQTLMTGTRKPSTAPPIVSQPTPVERPQPTPEVPLPIGPAPSVVRPEKQTDALPGPAALTLNDFAATFQPTPGAHEVRIVHPYTKELVTVAFTLPEGAPKQVHVNRRQIDFDYGKRSVSIRFRLKGSVEVTSN